MRKKGFTLIELLAVIIIFGIIIGLSVSAYSKYLVSSRNKSYKIAENSMKTAATEVILDCLNGNDNNYDICNNRNLLENQFDNETIKLSELITYDYINAIRDPSDTDLLCDDNSYVYVINKSDTNKVNNADLEYKVCLICGNYKSKDCIDNIDTESKYNAYCKVSYDELGNQPYDGKWTDKDLYLTLTADGDYKYGINYYTYKYGEINEKLEATNNQVVALLDKTVNNKTINITAVDGKSNKANATCNNTVKIDKEKIISAKITGKLAAKKTEIRSSEWASEDVLLTVTANPKSIPSGYLYQWYKNGVKIGTETTNNTYTAKEDGTYSVEVTNIFHNQKIKTNDFIVKIDRFKPVITANSNPLSLGNQDYNFVSNLNYTFGISGGSVSCSPALSQKTGIYDVVCTATGNNKLTNSVTFTARHSYAATYVSRTCSREACTSYSCEACSRPGGECCGWSWDGGCGGDMSSCAPSQECTGGWSCGCQSWATGACCGYYTDYYECGYYTCPNGGNLNGSTCYY